MTISSNSGITLLDNGLPPGGSDGQVLTKQSSADYDVDWENGGGGGGTPGGSDTNIQFNNAGSFGGDADFLYDTANKAFTVNSSLGGELSTLIHDPSGLSIEQDDGAGSTSDLGLRPNGLGVSIIGSTGNAADLTIEDTAITFGVAGASDSMAITVRPDRVDISGNFSTRLRITVAGEFMEYGTIISTGTTGNQTIDKPRGTVNFAAAASSLIVTNSLCTEDSHVEAFVLTNDLTMSVVKAIPDSGFFTIYAVDGVPTAETKVGFRVTTLI